MEESSKQLIEYLHKIAERSLDSNDSLIQVAPSTFKWIKKVGEGLFQIIIKKKYVPFRKISSYALEGDYMDKGYIYLFQVRDCTKNQTVLFLSSSERSDIEDALKEIFNNVEKIMDKKATNILGELFF